VTEPWSESNGAQIARQLKQQSLTTREFCRNVQVVVDVVIRKVLITVDVESGKQAIVNFRQVGEGKETRKREW